jgi:stage II sporulation protein M
MNLKKYLAAYIEDFRSMKYYIAVSALLFAVGILIGAKSDVFHAYLNAQLQGLGEIANELSGKDHASLWFFLFIFFNNAIKSILIMYLGGLFVFLPVIFLVFNGMILGYLFSEVAASGENVWLLIVKGILPHGIIELPVIIIACAFGLRFGVLVLRILINLLRTKETRSRTYKETEAFLYRTLHMMVFLTVSLLIAAIIESTFTFWLMNQ